MVLLMPAGSPEAGEGGEGGGLRGPLAVFVDLQRVFAELFSPPGSGPAVGCLSLLLLLLFNPTQKAETSRAQRDGDGDVGDGGARF
ncbi:hypothetical protein PBY51_018396 [Eleginops maclovinus]|uniref:Uncharacterized protein n=1 Tax=Eleginops maclovinus TaxID=56733 RepID=A0AAN7Y0B3_ELEMC|nr:hypothetical protein PBY51_018396 [Eleginops maclovinus]